MCWGCLQTLQGLEEYVSKELSGVQGCFYLHPGICSRKKDAVQCLSVLVTYILPDELTIHADRLRGGFPQPR